MIKSKTINLIPFDWKVVFVYTKTLQQGVDYYNLDYKVENTTYGLCLTDEAKLISYVIIDTEFKTETLVHEINHVVLDLFEWIGYNPTKMQEFFCYYSHYLFSIGEKFYNTVKTKWQA